MEEESLILDDLEEETGSEMLTVTEEDPGSVNLAELGSVITDVEGELGSANLADVEKELGSVVPDVEGELGSVNLADVEDEVGL